MENCVDCENLLVYKRKYTQKQARCIYGLKEIDIVECSHFKEKPEDTISKPLKSARLSTSCVQPNNHGRKGTMPRSRKGCFKAIKSARQAFQIGGI